MSTKTIDFFTNKSITPKCLLSDLVYRFNCNWCNATYIGETGRHLCTRVQEHTRISSMTSSKVAAHCFSCSLMASKPGLSDFSVVTGGFGNYYERTVYEALYIRKMKPTLNLQIDTGDLLNIFK